MPISPLASVPAGSDVLIDANILIYGLLRSSPQCARFLDRCNAEELYGYTTVEVVNEVCHRLMVYEAAANGMIPKSTASALRAAGSRMTQLSVYWSQTERIVTGNFLIMPLDELRVVGAARLRRQFPLLTNDSLLLAAADQFGIPALASNDADFAAVPWLQIYRPDDVV
jgi:predicted nucleic acid-binding protein